MLKPVIILRSFSNTMYPFKPHATTSVLSVDRTLQNLTLLAEIFCSASFSLDFFDSESQGVS